LTLNFVIGFRPAAVRQFSSLLFNSSRYRTIILHVLEMVLRRPTVSNIYAYYERGMKHWVRSIDLHIRVILWQRDDRWWPGWDPLFENLRRERNATWMSLIFPRGLPFFFGILFLSSERRKKEKNTDYVFMSDERRFEDRICFGPQRIHSLVAIYLRW